MTKKGFTLIELIVVITILAILGTIAFIGFKGYTSDARDSKVVTDIANLNGVLSILKASEGTVPMPDSAITVTSGGIPITYEGEVGDNVRNKLKASSDTKTPAGVNYLYATNGTQKNYTLVGLLEKEQTSLSQKTFAENEAEVKHFKGDTVLVLFDDNNNFIGGEVSGAISNLNKAYLGDKELEITSNIVQNIPDQIKKNETYTYPSFLSCSDILIAGKSKGNGIYSLLINDKAEEVYCDMTTDGGGWMLFGELSNYSSNISGATGVGLFDNGTISTPGYSFDLRKLSASSTGNFDVLIKYGKDSTYNMTVKGLTNPGGNYITEPTLLQNPQPRHGIIGSMDDLRGGYGLFYCANTAGCLGGGNNYLNISNNTSSEYRPRGGTIKYGWFGYTDSQTDSSINHTWINAPSGDNTEYMRYYVRLNSSFKPNSCKEILQAGQSFGDGQYTIYPNGIKERAYCDMTSDGGGWTRVLNMSSGTLDYTLLNSLSGVKFDKLKTTTFDGLTRTLNAVSDNLTMGNIIDSPWLVSGHETDKYKQVSQLNGGQTNTLYLTNDDDTGTNCSNLRQADNANTPYGILSFGYSDGVNFSDAGTCDSTKYVNLIVKTLSVK